MSELALVNSVDVDNPVEHDLRLVNGQLILIGDTAATESDAVAQHIKVRFLFFRAEWFLDRREGIPYFEEVFVKNPNLNALRGLYRGVLAGTPGVDTVESVTLAINTALRQLDVSFVVVLDSGAVLRSEDFGPFIVEV